MPKTDSLWKLVLIILIVVVIIVLVEGISRTVLYQEPLAFPPIFVEDSELCWRLTPNVEIEFNTKEFKTQVEIGPQGFRKGEVGKIMVLGDSFTFGSGVNQDETYSALIGNSINLGVPNYGTVNHRKVVEKYIDKLKPEVILLSFYPNDPRDNLMNCSYYIMDSHLITKGTEVSKLRLWLQLHSNLYRIVRVYRRSKEPPIDLKQYRPEYDEETQRAWDITYEEILKIKELAGDIPVVLLYIPAKEQLDMELQLRLMKAYGILDANYERLQTNLAEFCAENEIYFLDLTQSFIKKGIGNTYYEKDPHWTPLGHQIAAQEITRFLQNVTQ